MQLISLLASLFTVNKLKLFLKPYEILSTGQGCGIIEFLPDCLSIDYIKRKIQGLNTGELLDYFVYKYGKENSKTYMVARKNFCNSLSAYSLLCYIL